MYHPALPSGCLFFAWFEEPALWVSLTPSPCFSTLLPPHLLTVWIALGLFCILWVNASISIPTTLLIFISKSNLCTGSVIQMATGEHLRLDGTTKITHCSAQLRSSLFSVMDNSISISRAQAASFSLTRQQTPSTPTIQIRPGLGQVAPTPSLPTAPRPRARQMHYGYSVPTGFMSLPLSP